MTDPVALYRAALPPGEVVDFATTAMDRVGVPVWSVSFYAAEGPDAGGHGYGETTAEAATGAYGELTEATRSLAVLSATEPRRAPYAALVRELGPDGVADPLTLCLPAGSDYAADRPLDWVPATRHRTGETVLVPAELAAARAADLPGGPPPGGWLVTLITNGQGAGDTLERALSHGLLELLQRDGNGLAFRALDRGVVLDTAGVTDPGTRALLDRLDGVGVLPKLAATDFGLANVFVVGADRGAAEGSTPDAMALAVTAAGEAAHPDRERALRKAVLEFAAARVRKVFTHGPLAPVEAVAPPGYLAGYLARMAPDPTGGEEERALEGMVDWLGRSAADLHALLADTVLARRSTVPFADLPTVAPGSLADPAALLADVDARLAAEGLDVLYVDQSGRGVHAVKAIVPGLEVETMTYGRIGERGVRRLLERGSDLVGVGTPPPPGAAPVPLTADAVERLGGPAWLDLAAVERTVGARYPLYREPGRHVAARTRDARDARTRAGA